MMGGTHVDQSLEERVAIQRLRQMVCKFGEADLYLRPEPKESAVRATKMAPLGAPAGFVLTGRYADRFDRDGVLADMRTVWGMPTAIATIHDLKALSRPMRGRPFSRFEPVVLRLAESLRSHQSRLLNGQFLRVYYVRSQDRFIQRFDGKGAWKVPDGAEWVGRYGPDFRTEDLEKDMRRIPGVFS